MVGTLSTKCIVVDGLSVPIPSLPSTNEFPLTVEFPVTVTELAVRTPVTLALLIVIPFLIPDSVICDKRYSAIYKTTFNYLLSQ